MSTRSSQSVSAWEGVPRSVLFAIGREVEGREILGIDCPMPNGCWRCIGCGKLLSRDSNWNQCPSCNTREPEEH